MIKTVYNSVKSTLRSLNSVQTQVLSPKLKLHHRHETYDSM